MSESRQNRPRAGQAPRKSREKRQPEREASPARRGPEENETKRDAERETRTTQSERDVERGPQDEGWRRYGRDDEPSDVRGDLFEDEDRDERRGERDSWVDERE